MKQTTNTKFKRVSRRLAQQMTNNIRAAITFGLSLALPLTGLFPFISARAHMRDQLQMTAAITQQDSEKGRVVRSYRAEQSTNLRGQMPKTQSINKQQATLSQAQPLPLWARSAMQKSVAYLVQKPEILQGSNAARDLFLHSVSEDNLGQTHVRLAQHHNDIEVFGGQVITHLSQREEPFVSGRLFAVNDADTTPSIAAEQAIQFAKDALAYAGEFAAEPTAKLIVLPNSFLKDDNAEGATLVWQVELRIEDGTNATAHHQYFVRAADGTIIWHFDSLPKSGTGHSLYHGKVTVPSELHLGYQFQLGGGRIRLINLKNTTDAKQGVGFFNKTNIWGDSTQDNAETAATDAAYAINQTWEYFLNIHGRNGYDGRGTSITAYVHYGVNYNNATGGGGFVTFGDGDGTTNNPFVAVDCVAHEFTHNVVENTAGLIYANESGALNESYADIFGTAVEFYDNYKSDYLINEEIVLPAGGASRSLVNPMDFGVDPNHYSKVYKGEADNGGVHSNSGISNHAFYLLAEGGIHRFSRVQVPGIGRAAAERIFYRALSEYLTPASNFIAARFATVKAAADLYGYQSAQWHAVNRAWDAVGVGYNRFETVQNATGNSIALTGPPEWGSIPTAKVALPSVTNPSAFSVTNKGVGDFAKWAADPQARKLTGDFDGNGFTDIALTGPNYWSSLPVAFATGNGSFNVTNHYIGDFAKYAAQGATVLTGDFNGDGKTDIAMTGGAGWGTLPVAFSNGNGTFAVTNQWVGSFAQWATEGATALAADFNGDGKTDVALTGPGHWATMPVAYSNGYGGFSINNFYVGDFAQWSAQNAKKVVGDFNRDGKADVALIGGNGWGSVPVAYSFGDGFVVTNVAINPDFAGDAALSGTQVISGDFNGDRQTDIALILSDGTLRVAYSQAEGLFSVKKDYGFEPSWLRESPQIVAGDFNGDGKDDIGLTGVPGWASLPIAFSNGNRTFRVTNDGISNFATWAATNANGSGRALALTGNFRSGGLIPR